VFAEDPIGANHRPDGARVAERLRKFELAVEDLRTHVELL
jgi:hypothetical protein